MASFIDDEVNFDEDQSTQFIPKVMEGAYNFSVNTSATDLGQFGLKQLDRILWVFEKTAKWSCRESYGMFAFSAFCFFLLLFFVYIIALHDFTIHISVFI